MIKLSRLTDYAIVILAQMAADGKGVYAASALAEKTSLPLPTVSKVLKQLTKNGILKALRGASGGYCLASEPAEVSIASLIEAMDGPISITECAATSMEESRCQVKQSCRVRGNWYKINAAICKSLRALTLADMTAKDLNVSSFNLPAAE